MCVKVVKGTRVYEEELESFYRETGIENIVEKQCSPRSA